MKKCLLSLWLLASAMAIQAQNKLGNVWLFGNRVGLDFSSGKPVPIKSFNHGFVHGSSVQCDENGNLLFYSNQFGKSKGLSIAAPSMPLAFV